jgi:vancomycin resistance protein VanJ
LSSGTQKPDEPACWRGKGVFLDTGTSRFPYLLVSVNRPVARFVSIALWTYAGGLLVWFVARAVNGDESALVLSLSYLGPWLFFPWLVFAPWVLFNGSKSGFIPLAFVAGLFLWLYGPLLLPRRAPAVDLVKPVSVLTLNVQFTNTDFDALVGVLGATDADVLALQEVRDVHEAQLSAALADTYPHHWYYERSGLALYSAHPILSRQIYPAEPWSVQSIVISVHDTPLHVINAHLAQVGVLPALEKLDLSPVRDLAAAKANQITQIQNGIRETGLPAIVACDCNMTDLTAAYARMTAGLQDAFRERGWGLGHTFLLPRGFEVRTRFNLPVQRIDYLFHSPEIRVADVHVGSSDTGSDHRSVWARFDLHTQAGNPVVGTNSLHPR